MKIVHEIDFPMQFSTFADLYAHRIDIPAQYSGYKINICAATEPEAGASLPQEFREAIHVEGNAKYVRALLEGILGMLDFYDAEKKAEWEAKFGTKRPKA